MQLIVVESPTKAKTLSRFLGPAFKIEASMGHIRDLPKSKLGVNIDKGFEPEYVIDKTKAKIIKLLRDEAQKADEIILATDPDREGEAIAFHVKYVIEQKLKNKRFDRIVFHEITKAAIESALKQPGQIDKNLFEAQQSRRVLDRLVGYKLSPLLWRKVRRGLSAGRVQSVAVRLIVEREEEIKAFKPQEYWEIKARLKKQPQEFEVWLSKLNNKTIKIVTADEAGVVGKELDQAQYRVGEVLQKEVARQPYPPFITSSLQRAAANRLGWSAKKTMREAQQLYEKGLITYHRTDSVNLAKEAVDKVRQFIDSTYGKQYVPQKPHWYSRQSKMVQGAHEAIRPTDVVRLTVDVKSAEKLYQLIWQRFVACQMTAVVLRRTIVKVTADCGSKQYELKTNGESVVFDGWLKVNPKGVVVNGQVLPVLVKADKLELVKIDKEQKFTQPPARYSEASLIKVLEDKGIGRPSTYAPIISTILSRKYVEKKEKSLYPTVVGTAVTQFLLKYFPKVMDYDFTAEMEGDLDLIASGKKQRQNVLEKFYKGFDKRVEEALEKGQRQKIEVEKTGRKCPQCQKGDEVIRMGRFGQFLSCSLFPECKYTANYRQVVEGVKCPECDGEVVIKKTKRGKQFFGCANYPKCKWASWNNPKKAK